MLRQLIYYPELPPINYPLLNLISLYRTLVTQPIIKEPIEINNLIFPQEPMTKIPPLPKIDEVSTSEPEPERILPKPKVKIDMRCQKIGPNWNEDCDNTLSELAIKYKNDWKKVARRMLTLTKVKRTPTFFKNRYRQIKSSSLKHGTRFTLNEDLKLLAGISVYGRDWVKIASHFKERGPTSLKNRYYCSIIKRDMQDKLQEMLVGKDLQSFLNQ